VTDEASAAALKIPIVATFMRCGVSQVAWCAWSQLRVALAPVIAANAHPAHMARL
jgi:hypothetical protein